MSNPFEIFFPEGMSNPLDVVQAGRLLSNFEGEPLKISSRDAKRLSAFGRLLRMTHDASMAIAMLRGQDNDQGLTRALRDIGQGRIEANSAEGIELISRAEECFIAVCDACGRAPTHCPDVATMVQRTARVVYYGHRRRVR